MMMKDRQVVGRYYFVRLCGDLLIWHAVRTYDLNLRNYTQNCYDLLGYRYIGTTGIYR
jgi:hypothetical protein